MIHCYNVTTVGQLYPDVCIGCLRHDTLLQCDNCWSALSWCRVLVASDMIHCYNVTTVGQLYPGVVLVVSDMIHCYNVTTVGQLYPGVLYWLHQT